jgi:ATP/maltotriose-dependent transcriptional regulator MalT
VALAATPSASGGGSLLVLDRKSNQIVRVDEVTAAAAVVLAKAHIRQGDLASARKELQAVVALEGDRRAEASNLLTQIR